MAKRLQITYDGNTLYDGEPEQFSWRESGESIEVKAGPQQPNPLAAALASNLGGRQRSLPSGQQ